MSNELKKQSKQNEMQKIETTALVVSENLNENLVDKEWLAGHYGTTQEAVRQQLASLNIKPVKYVMKGERKNIKTALYDLNEIKSKITHQQQQVALAKLDTKTDKMNNKYSFDELKIAFGKSLENQSSKEIGNLGLQLIAIAMNKQSEAFAKENEEKDELLKQLEAKNQELQAYQNENKYIQETKHKIDVLKAKITKAVRTKAYQNHWTYKETYVRYYKLYDEAHNFPYKEDYNGYINTVEKRGHLLELYNIIVNDF